MGGVGWSVEEHAFGDIPEVIAHFASPIPNIPAVCNIATLPFFFSQLLLSLFYRWPDRGLGLGHLSRNAHSEETQWRAKACGSVSNKKSDLLAFLIREKIYSSTGFQFLHVHLPVTFTFL